MPTRNLSRAADRLADVPRLTARKAADLVVEVADDEARRATGGDGRMSGMGRRGPKLRAVARVTGRGSQAAAVIRGVPAGAWSILESGARPHVIAPRRRNRNRVLYGRGLRHPVTGPVRHPGVRGRRTWRRVVTQAKREVPDLFRDEVLKAVR